MYISASILIYNRAIPAAAAATDSWNKDPPPLSPFFPGWGSYDLKMEIPSKTLEATQKELDAKHKDHPLLNQWQASSICSNDILSSCFYTIGLVTAYAGKLAPVSLFCVGMALYVFRSIYGEAISAYPLNGGSYNLLINSTSKAVAAMGACLSVIAYIATGVVSAVTASNYLNEVVPELNAEGFSIFLLFLFALVVFCGITESATVAMVSNKALALPSFPCSLLQLLLLILLDTYR